MKRRFLTAAVTLAAFAATAAPASSATYTTFEAMSEGCSGGGKVCGTFPLIPSGAATYSHAAASDGSVDLSASTTGGLPLTGQRFLDCLPAACPPGQYHAESLASVWVDVDVPAGANALSIRAAYRLDELIAATEATLGAPMASLTGAVIIGEQLGDALCSDGSATTGSDQIAIGPGSAIGAHEAEAVIGCASEAATLPAASWRVALSLDAAATTDGGTATAGARAQLVSVEAEAA